MSYPYFPEPLMNEENKQEASSPETVPGAWPGTPPPLTLSETVLAEAVARMSVQDDSTGTSGSFGTKNDRARSIFDDLPDHSRGLPRRLRGLGNASVIDNPFDNLGPLKTNNVFAMSGNRISRPRRKTMGLKPKANVIRVCSSKSNSVSRPTPQAHRDVVPSLQRASLSNKNRVQGTLRSKRVEALRTEAAVDFINKSLPATPASILTTSMEMYDSEPHRQSSQPRERPPLSQSFTNTSKRVADTYPLTPIENDLAALAVLAALPELTSQETRLDRSPTSAQTQLGRSSSIRLPTGSVLTVITPEQTAWQHTQYIPGPIRIQRSVTQAVNHDLFSLASVAETPSMIAAKNVASEDVEMQEIADYFEAFGFDPVSFELDDFWLDRARSGSIMSDAQSSILPASRKSSVRSDARFSFLSNTGSSLLLPPPASPAPSSVSRLSGTTAVSRLSGTSATRASAVRRPAPPAAQKMGLRRLMMSATGIL